MYTPSESVLTQIENSHTYHPPKAGLKQAERYEDMRATARRFASQMAHNCPASRELALALTKLEEAVMWANAAIARNE